MVGNCLGGISGVDILIFRVNNGLIFTVGYVIILVLLSCVRYLIIWCTWLRDINFTVCDCQCGISSVGI